MTRSDDDSTTIKMGVISLVYILYGVRRTPHEKVFFLGRKKESGKRCHTYIKSVVTKVGIHEGVESVVTRILKVLSLGWEFTRVETVSTLT